MDEGIKFICLKRHHSEGQVWDRGRIIDMTLHIWENCIDDKEYWRPVNHMDGVMQVTILSEYG